MAMDRWAISNGPGAQQWWWWGSPSSLTRGERVRDKEVKLLWDIRRGSWDCAKLIIGCCEEGPEGEEGGGGEQGGLGRSKHGKTEKRDIKGARWVCKLPVNMLF